jgi:pentatricopeptide repeat protein
MDRRALLSEKAAADARVKGQAEFYLGQAYALFGSADRSRKTVESFLATAQLPQQFKDQARVLQAANLYTMNRKADAMKVWDELAGKPSRDPDVLAEILFTCRRLKAECSNAARQGAAMADAGEGRKFSTLNIALGKYYLGRLDTARAVTYLEAGRDKSNKNKIESNDPEMLVSLADAYFRTKKFSEALEIYFEMSKQFPEVRQLQEAMQGVYAMEHRAQGRKINYALNNCGFRFFLFSIPNLNRIRYEGGAYETDMDGSGAYRDRCSACGPGRGGPQERQQAGRGQPELRRIRPAGDP